MLRRTLIALSCLAMLAATFAALATAPVQAQNDPGLRLNAEFIIPGTRFLKGPQVAAGRGQVFVSGNANSQDTNLWGKAATANAFGSPLLVAEAEAEGKPDWSGTSVAVGPDGSLYYAWINAPARSIFLRVRDPEGGWGPARLVDRGSFPFPVQVAVSTTGQVFVAWRDGDLPIRFRTTLDRGVTFSGRQEVTQIKAFNNPITFGIGPNGRVAISFVAAGEGDRLQVYAGVWNGTSFVVSQVSPNGGDYANGSVAYGPDGKLYAAWRGVAESGGNAGVFFSEQQPDGSWPRSRLIGGKVVGNVNVSADEGGNIHISWVGAPSGSTTVYYAFKPASAPFRGPIGSADTGALFDPDGAASIVGGPLNHVVSEEFNGGVVNTRYSLFAADAVAFGGQPVVADGAARVAPAADGTVKLSFRNLAGGPTQIRWRWGAAPTDAASDSNGWQALASEMRLPVPEAVRNDTSCRPTTLFTQLRNGTTTEPEARSVAVNLDGIVEAQVSLDNPFTRAAAQGGLAGIEGAPGGAPNYTRVPLTWLNVVSDSDCSGITVAGIGPSADKIEQTFVINDGAFGGLVSLPNFANLKPGPVPFVVRVVDGVGNVRIFNLEVILDETKPVLNGGQATASPSPDGDLLQVLSFEDVNVSDSQYPGGFWGVWMANSRERVADPLNDPSLNWTVVQAPVERPGGDFVIDDWSLATGLSNEQLVPGEDYYIYVRFIDGAGNPTDGFVTVPVASSNLQRPLTQLPMIRR